MEITFEDANLEDLFRDMDNVRGAKNLMQKKVGLPLAAMIKKRKNQLKASTTFAAYLQTGLGKPHSLSGSKFYNCYGVSLSANMRLIIQPSADDTSPESLSVCDTVIIKGVVEYHGSKDEWLIP